MNRRELLKYACALSALGGLQLVGSTLPPSVLRLLGIEKEFMAEAANGCWRQTQAMLVDTSIGTAGLVSSGVNAGDATWSLTEVTDPTYLRPHSPSAPGKVFKLQVLTPGSVTSSYKLDFTVNVIPRNIENFWIVGRGENLNAHDHGGNIFLSKDGTFANYYSMGIGYAASSGDESQWRYVLRNKAIWTVGAGSPVDSQTFTRLRYILGAAAGDSPTYYICPVWINILTSPIVTIGFDDRNANDFTNAYAYMHPRGLPGYCALTSGSGSNTVANCLTMQAAGWSMHNHSDSHPDFGSVGTPMTEQQMVTEVETCRAYLIANGLNSGTNAFVYPYGSRNALSDTVLNRYYPFQMLANSPSADQTLWDGLPNNTRVTRAVMDVTITADQLKQNLNIALSKGNSMNLYGHNVTASAGAGKTDLAVFQSVMDYVTSLAEAGAIEVRNLQNMLTGQAV